MHDFLLTHDTPAQYARALHETVDVLAVHLAGARSPRSAATPEELEELVAAVDLERPLGDLGAVVEVVVCAIDRSPAGENPLADVGLEVRAVLTKAELDAVRAG